MDNNSSTMQSPEVNPKPEQEASLSSESSKSNGKNRQSVLLLLFVVAFLFAALGSSVTWFSVEKC